MPHAASPSPLGPHLAALVDAVGSPLVESHQVTTLALNRDVRGSWRLRFADGRTLKGRRFESPQRAAHVMAVRQAAPLGMFVDVIAHAGDAMLEEWVDGRVLADARPTPEQVRRSGEMLGRLHACPPPRCSGDGAMEELAGVPIAVDVATWRGRIAGDLRVLIDAGLLTRDRAAAVESCVGDNLPGEPRIGVVHRDLCPDNIVVDTAGALRWIDAGTLTVGPIDEDLCRVWRCWAMTAAEREAFAAGYAEHGDASALLRPPVFWLIAVLCNAARVRLANAVCGDAAQLVARLERVVERCDAGVCIDDPAGVRP